MPLKSRFFWWLFTYVNSPKKIFRIQFFEKFRTGYCVNSITYCGGSVIGFDQYEGPLKIYLRAAHAFFGVPKNATKMQLYLKLTGSFQSTELELE